jgi:hypothetical protein
MSYGIDMVGVVFVVGFMLWSLPVGCVMGYGLWGMEGGIGG